MYKKIYFLISVLFLYSNCHFCNSQFVLEVNLNENSLLMYKEIFHDYSKAFLVPHKKKYLASRCLKRPRNLYLSALKYPFCPLSHEEKIQAIAYFLDKYNLNPTMNETLDLRLVAFIVINNLETTFL